MSTFVYVVHYSYDRDSAGVRSVYLTRDHGLVAALNSIAENVEFDWNDFDTDRLRKFARYCSSGQLDDALDFWNKEMDADYRVHVIMEEAKEAAVDKLAMDFPPYCFPDGQCTSPSS